MAFRRADGAWVALALSLCLLGRASVAAAAGAEDRAAARQHLSQAEQLKKQGQLGEACKHLEEVERLDPKLPTLMDLAECTEQVGRLVDARKFWALARDRAKHDEKPQSRARAEARLAAVEKRVAHLTLQLSAAAAGAQVLRDDLPVDPAALSSALPMDPGDHMLVVKLAGHEDAKYPVKLVDGDNQTVALSVGPPSSATASASATPVAAGPPPPPAPAAPPPTAPATEAPVAKGFWTAERKVGVVVGAAGLGATAGGVLLALHAKSGDADPRLALGGIAIVGGGVLLVSGIALLASGAGEENTQRAGLSPTVLVTPRVAFLGASGAF